MKNTECKKTAEYFNENVPEYCLERFGLIVDFIKKQVKSDSNFLDIGCGAGNVLQMIQDQTGIQDLYGMDIAENYLNETGKKVEFKSILGSILDEEIVGKYKNKFDFVMLSAVLHHLIGDSRADSIELAKKALDNAFQLVKPQGYFLLVEPAYAPTISNDFIFNIKKFFSSFVDGRIELFTQGLNIGDPIVSFLTPDQIKNMMQNIDNNELLGEKISSNGVPLAMRFLFVKGTYNTNFISRKIK
ncbi:MAG: class I SAM-dependent methyltransferase [bacterium]